ncbi:MAG: hypothetical protein HUJ56_07575, partial [Erysipelotrichaceae bacterium]|nr:hypothetical protein [Erysipelotrichaceae bacterium]
MSTVTSGTLAGNKQHVGQGAYNNYNSAMNAVNQYGAQNNDDWNNVGWSQY